MRKLVGDGFVEKKAGTPASYKITEKGLGFNLEEKENAE
jgi:predicted transcriptional regulator